VIFWDKKSQTIVIPIYSTTVQIKRDAKAVALALTGLEENNHFDHDRDKQLLVSFSAGFTSTANDEIIGERAAEVEREMQKLDNSNLNHGSEAQGKGLSSLRKIPKLRDEDLSQLN